MAETSTPQLTLILVPGLLCDARVWAAQSVALKSMVDVRVSEHGTHDSLPAMAQAILDKAPPRFAIAGHSMGGRIALEVFRAAPERVAGIALMDTGHHPLAGGEAGQVEAQGRFALLAKAREQGMRAMARDWVLGMVHPARLTDEPLIEAILDMFESSSAEVYAAQIRGLLDRPDGTPLLALLRCPALILCGHEDSWAPVQRHREMAAAIPGSAFVDIPNCGHMSTMECPDAVNAAMSAWLRTVIESDKASGAGNSTRQRVAGARP